ncbi:hypothetical protein CF165_23625 [Amycolatopsis vastitatis]|uniref:Uncharacterized protein n=1 Tax=Amycolatopsis vastitatis TaxID=1905142 RepID=A0A229T291_9PSEU|nr:hypothetical protein CF165_23625 [Amycolatopsis vastitatis]
MATLKMKTQILFYVLDCEVGLPKRLTHIQPLKMMIEYVLARWCSELEVETVRQSRPRHCYIHLNRRETVLGSSAMLPSLAHLSRSHYVLVGQLEIGEILLLKFDDYQIVSTN